MEIWKFNFCKSRAARKYGTFSPCKQLKRDLETTHKKSTDSRSSTFKESKKNQENQGIIHCLVSLLTISSFIVSFFVLHILTCQPLRFQLHSLAAIFFRFCFLLQLDFCFNFSLLFTPVFLYCSLQFFFFFGLCSPIAKPLELPCEIG